MKIIEERIVDVYTLRLMDDGIVHIHTSDEKPETIKGQKEAVKIFEEMVNYKNTPLLFTHASFAIPSSEVRSYWSKKESCPYCSAEAHVTNSPGLLITGNFYLKMDKPERLTKLFSNEEEALAWLKTFL